MGRKYTAIASADAHTTAGDILQIVCPTDAALIIHRAFVGQDSDAGDADANMNRMQIKRATTDGSGGGTVTARPLSQGDPAFGGTILGFNTSDATGLIELIDEPWNVQSGWLYDPAPEERIEVSPGDTLVFAIQKVPGSAIDVVITVLFEEIGG